MYGSSAYAIKLLSSVMLLSLAIAPWADAEARPSPSRSVVAANQESRSVDGDASVLDPQSSRPQQATVLLLVNGRASGWVELRVEPQHPGEFHIQTLELVQLQASVFPVSLHEDLLAAADSRGLVSLRDIENLGLDTTVDEDHAELNIEIPRALYLSETAVSSAEVPVEGSMPSLQLQISHDAEYTPPDDPEPTASSVEPSSLSLAFNPVGQRVNGVPQRLNAELDVSLGNWALEGQTLWRDGAFDTWPSGYWRLVGMDTDIDLQVEIGDLSVPAIEFQPSYRIVGFGLDRSFGESSQLDAMASASRLRLCGDDCSTTSDDQGFDEFSTDAADLEPETDTELRSQAVHHLAYSVGLPFAVKNEIRQFDNREPRMSLSYRFTPNPIIELQTFLQGDANRQLFGLSGQWESFLGHIEFDLVVSNHEVTDYGYAAKLQYARRWSDDAPRHQIAFSVTYRDSAFMTLEQNRPNNKTALEVGWSYEQPIVKDVQGRLDGHYQFGRNTIADGYRTSLNLAAPLQDRVHINLNLAHTRNRDGDREQRAALELDWEFSDDREDARNGVGGE